MSLDQIRRLKLLNSLQAQKRGHYQSQIKRKLSNTISLKTTNIKLNKNKKYMLQEERNTQIERDNRLLYEKIMNNFKSLQQSKSIVQSRTKWRRYKQKNSVIKNMTIFNGKDETRQQLKYLSRVNTIQQQSQQMSTLFHGNDEIDGHSFKIKLLLDKDYFYLIAKNVEIEIRLQMSRKDYMRLHNNELKRNPCNIFKYLQIIGNNVNFRSKNHSVSQKLHQIF